MNLKPVEEVTCCVCDYGSFESLADCLADTMETVFYYSPFEQEYRDINNCCIGEGLENVIRCNEPLDPDVLDDIDLFVFPDIGYGGLQRHLRSLGKAVWGATRVTDYELFRTKFLTLLRELKLPIAPSVVVKGITALAEHLKNCKDKWVKINRYRENMETWHHIDWAHSERMLEGLSLVFGGAKEQVTFVVQDPIDTEIEIGYDGWTVDGKFPPRSFQGYEKKNELYLGAWLPDSSLPKEIQQINEALASLLKANEYRNQIATEIRVKGAKGFYIDPTMRMAGQTQEHLQNSCTNLARVIWEGANGILVPPEFSHKVAAEATMHYKAGEPKDWKTLRIPEEARRWCKFYHYCIYEGLYHFPPYRNDEVGVIIGLGDTKEAAVEALRKNFKLLEGEPLEICEEKFEDLFKEITRAEARGMKFSS
jgi:hypothetical protein